MITPTWRKKVPPLNRFDDIFASKLSLSLFLIFLFSLSFSFPYLSLLFLFSFSSLSRSLLLFSFYLFIFLNISLFPSLDNSNLVLLYPSLLFSSFFLFLLLFDLVNKKISIKVLECTQFQLTRGEG